MSVAGSFVGEGLRASKTRTVADYYGKVGLYGGYLHDCVVIEVFLAGQRTRYAVVALTGPRSGNCAGSGGPCTELTWGLAALDPSHPSVRSVSVLFTAGEKYGQTLRAILWVLAALEPSRQSLFRAFCVYSWLGRIQSSGGSLRSTPATLPCIS